MSCSGENVNKQRNRYPLHFWKTNGVLFEHYELKRKFQYLVVSRMNSSNSTAFSFFSVAFMKFFMETPENLTFFPGPKKTPGKKGSTFFWVFYYIRKHSLNL